MKIIRPALIDDTAFQSSNVLEDEHVEWDGTTNWVVNDSVRVTAAGIHKNYICVVANTNFYPPDFCNKTMPAPASVKWLETGPTNKWAMVTGSMGSRTVRNDNITITLKPGAVFNAIGLLDLSAAEVVITVNDPIDGVVYSNTINMVSTDGVDDMYKYLTEPVKRKKDLILFDLPSYGTATVTIAINDPGNVAQAGLVIVGIQKELGFAQLGGSFGIRDFSLVETDDFGNTDIAKRPYSKKANIEMRLPNDRVDDVTNTVAEYRSIKLLWVYFGELTITAIYGIYRDFEVVIKYQTTSYCTMKILGVI